MAKIREFLSRIRFVYRRTSNVTKIVVAVTIVVCMATLITLRLSMTALENRTEDMRQKAGQLEAANQELEDKISELGSDKSTVEIAENELDLVQPGAVVMETEP
jgi:cell division protein FtsB